MYQYKAYRTGIEKRAHELAAILQENGFAASVNNSDAPIWYTVVVNVTEERHNFLGVAALVNEYKCQQYGTCKVRG